MIPVKLVGALRPVTCSLRYIHSWVFVDRSNRTRTFQLRFPDKSVTPCTPFWISTIIIVDQRRSALASDLDEYHPKILVAAMIGLETGMTVTRVKRIFTMDLDLELFLEERVEDGIPRICANTIRQTPTSWSSGSVTKVHLLLPVLAASSPSAYFSAFAA